MTSDGEAEALDRMNAPRTGGPNKLNDLIARKKYAKAVELLRAELEGRMSPPPQMRLQLADLLVLAGRSAEAVPILIGLADEFTSDGYVARAVAILKRVERISPGQPEVETRLVSLVRRQRTTAVAEESAAEPTVRKTEEAGTMTSSDERNVERSVAESSVPVPVDVSPTTPAQPPAQAATLAGAGPASGPVAGDDTAPSQEAGIVGRLRGAFRRFFPGTTEPNPDQPDLEDKEAPAPTPPMPDLDQTASTVPETSVASQPAEGEVNDRIRQAFRSFLASLPEPPVSQAEPEIILSDEELAPAAEPIILVGDDDDAAAGRGTAPIVLEPEIDQVESVTALEEQPAATEGATAEVVQVIADADAPAEPEILVEAVEVASEATETPIPVTADSIVVEGEEKAAEPAVIEDEAAEIPEQEFHEKVLDLVEDVLRPPPQQVREGQPFPAVELASRLLASPLFAELNEEELLSVVRDLTLRTAEPGDILLTEGERSDDLYIVTAGVLKVFVRNPDRRNFVVGRLQEGDYFGELSTLSGRRRSATVTAATRTELLILAKPALDAVAFAHPKIRNMLEDSYIRRASDPDVAAVRAVPLGDGGTQERAIEILEAHFGETRWDPRMRLRLADLLVKAGKQDDAIPILVGLADDLAREGFPAKAIAVLKKIEQIRRRHVKEVALAPLKKAKAPAVPASTTAAPAPSDESMTHRGSLGKASARTQAFFNQWLVDVVRDAARSRSTARRDAGRFEEHQAAAAAAVEAYCRGLKASPLFEGFSEEELLTLIRGLRLLSFEPGDVIVTAGEPGRSVFILASGGVRIFVRNPEGRNAPVVDLGEGSFFGEIAALSGRPRSATVVATTDCDILELDANALERITQAHPRLRDVLEEHVIERASSTVAAAIRAGQAAVQDPPTEPD